MTADQNGGSTTLLRGFSHVVRAGHRATVAAEQIRVLQRSGLIDVRRPDQILSASREIKVLGPIAGGVCVSARRHPDRVALIDGSTQMTYRELDRHTDAVGFQWTTAGVSPQSTVAVLCRDNLDLVATMVAAGKIGCRVVLMNTGFSARQLRDVARREGVTAFAYDDEFATTMRELPAHRRLPTSVVRRRRRTPVQAIPRPRQQGRFVLLTGGTTGTPKGATRRVESPLAAAQFLDRVPLRRGHTILLCAPLFHGTSLSQFILALNLGATVVLHGRFDAENALRQIAAHRCDMMVVVPTMLRRIVGLDPQTIAGYDTSSLRIVLSAGAALAPSLGDAVTALFGPCIHNFYGCTETGTATIATPHDWARAPGTVGRAPVGIDVVLFDESGARVHAADVKGVVHVRNSIAFEGGYSGGGDKAVLEGLMSTGDIGHWDDNGLLFIDGRDDDMIVSGGENVFPGEVEDVLSTHPAIAEAAVVGVPDAEFGQRLAAFVVLEKELTDDDVRSYVREHLARFKIPRDVVLVADIPRTATGKIDRQGIAAIHRDSADGAAQAD